MPTYIVYYSQGNSNGPFSIYLSGSSGLNLYASPVTRAELELGYTVTFPDGIPSSSVDVFDIAYGCFTDQNVPFPSVSPSITPTPTRTPSITPSITVSPSKTPSITATPSVTPSFSPPPSVTPTQTPSATPSESPNTSPSPTPTPSITRTPSPSPPTVYTPFYRYATYSQPYLTCHEFLFSMPYAGITHCNTAIPEVGSKLFSAGQPGFWFPVTFINGWVALATFSPVFARAVRLVGGDNTILEVALINTCT